MSAESEETSSSPPAVSLPDSKHQRRWRRLGIILLVIVIVAAVLGWMELQRRRTNQQLETTESELEQLKGSAESAGDVEADQVIEKVRKLIKLPTEPPPTVATINDVERLRETNEFFNSAENGDFLVLTGNRAIIYDPDQNIVVDVAPFQVNTASTAPAEATVSPSPENRPRDNQTAAPARRQ